LHRECREIWFDRGRFVKNIRNYLQAFGIIAFRWILYDIGKNKKAEPVVALPFALHQ
jgi:hypothetical protein